MQTAPKNEIRHGIIPGVTTFALDLVDRGQSTTIGVLHDVRHELRGAVDGGIELAEKVSASLFRLAKKVVQRVDDASAETLAGVEKLIGGAVKSARETSRIAGELAHSAVSNVTGPAQQAQA
jgi:hypothetical protein